MMIQYLYTPIWGTKENSRPINIKGYTMPLYFNISVKFITKCCIYKYNTAVTI